MQIVNAAGKVLMRQDVTLKQGRNQVKLYSDFLNSGVYFIQILSAGSCQQTGFVKVE